ncbi:unnamed protein product [Parnassius apollo]|uniref:(apollo) hypothetical protein n=1 Tax=Parnassius apollo TaxID=110799 RepID=A0A8S3WGR5_PARAO|nr:unnamed protein product [Parnassius apollo]
MSHSTIEEICLQEDRENETSSETKNYGEHSNYDSDTEQEADSDDIHNIPLQFEELILPVQLGEEYLDDVTLK